MASFNPQYVNLNGYEAAQLQRRANQQSPLDAALQGLNQGIQLQQLPQTLQDQALARQLNNLLTQQKIQDLQNPQAALARKLEEELTLKGALNPNLGIQRAAPGLVGETIANPQAINQTATDLNSALALNPNTVIPTAAPKLAETPISAFGIQTGLNSNPNIPQQAEEDKFNRDLQKSIASKRGATALHFTKVGNDLVGLDPISGVEVSRIPVDPTKKVMNTSQGIFEYDPANPSEGRIIPGTEKMGKSADLTPGQIISSKREVRATYDELPSKIDYFGKGQVQGSNQLKARLDAVLKPVNGDFSKLNPQAKQTFVFAINKLRDPTSATLLSEASQIASAAGIGDRFNAIIAGYKEGDKLPDQVAKDIYAVISQVEAAHKENLINQLIELKQDTDSLGVKLTSIGVPKDLQDEVIKRSNLPIQSPAQTPQVPVIKKNSLSSAQNFNTEVEARAAGFDNGDMVIINGQVGHLK